MLQDKQTMFAIRNVVPCTPQSKKLVDQWLWRGPADLPFSSRASSTFAGHGSQPCPGGRDCAITSKIVNGNESDHLGRKISSILHLSEQESCESGHLGENGSTLIIFIVANAFSR